MDRELERAKELARIAGTEVRRMQSGELEVEMKPGDEPVSVADRRASEIIVAGLKDYIGSREGEALEMLLVEIEDEHGQKSSKKFSGRWLVTDFASSAGDVWVSHAGTARTINHDCDETPWWVARTARGQIAVWANPPSGAGGFYVYRDLDEAEENGGE